MKQVQTRRRLVFEDPALACGTEGATLANHHLVGAIDTQRRLGQAGGAGENSVDAGTNGFAGC